MTTTNTKAAETEHIVKIAVDCIPNRFNPIIKWLDICGFAWMTNILYESLCLRLFNGTLMPWLAKSWEILDDGTRYVFHIDERAKWSDGTPVTAKDVEYTWTLIQQYAMSYEVQGVLKEVRAVDTHTVEFITTQPWVRWWRDFGSEVVLPAHVWSKLSSPVDYGFIDKPEEHITSSVWKYDSFKAEEWYLFKKRPDYWKTEIMPKIDGVLFRTSKMGDTSAYPMLLESGEVDAAIPCSVDLVETLKDVPNLHFWIYPNYTSCTGLAVNTLLYPLGLKEVRQAIDLAIDKPRYVDEILMGNGAPGERVLTNINVYTELATPEMFWPGKGKTHEENVAEANRILDGLGFAKGPDGVRVTQNGTRMEYIFPLTPESSTVGEFYQRNLMEIGIKVNFEFLDFAAMWSRVSMATSTKDFGFTIFSITEMVDYWEPPVRYALLPPETSGPWHTINWNNSAAQMANMYARRVLSSLDPNELVHNLKEVLKIWAEELPIVPTAYFTFARWAYRTDKFTSWRPETSALWGSFGYSTPIRGLVLHLLIPVEEATPTPSPGITPTPTPKPTATPTPTPVATPTPTAAPAGLSTEQIILIAVVIIIVIAVIGYMAAKAKKKT